MEPLLGAIADDFTGASDLAAMLTEEGVSTVLVLGDASDASLLDAQAVVIALKSRSTNPAHAQRESVAALDALRRLGARQIYFKYCSTFDSTEEGNIGPVIEALCEAMGVSFTVAVPSLPVNGRTQYAGHLFVHGTPLAESHMRHHPVTPMTDSNLVRHLQRQMRGQVGLVHFDVVRRGAPAIRGDMKRLEREGIMAALVDILTEEDLAQVAAACADLPLVTGGSGLGMALPAVWRHRSLYHPTVSPDATREIGNGTLVLSGSCSDVTLEQLDQVDHLAGSGTSTIRLDVLSLLSDPAMESGRLLEEVRRMVEAQGWALVSSSASADERVRVRNEACSAGLDVEPLGERIEEAFGRLAARAVESGLVRNVIVAGGETSGAVASALSLREMDVEAVIDPGVPVLRARPDPSLRLVFKSGNFGSRTFFEKALDYLSASTSKPAPHPA